MSTTATLFRLGPVASDRDKEIALQELANEINKLVGAAEVGDLQDEIDWTGVLNTPTTLGGYGITNAYTEAEVDALLSGKSSVGHTHAATDVVSGVFADARISQTSVTQHQAALSVDWTQIVNEPAFIAAWPVNAAGALTNNGAGVLSWAAAAAAAAGTLTGTVLAANVVTSSLTTIGTLIGDLLFTDATYDIGKSGATRPRDGFFSRNLTIGGNVAITGSVTSGTWSGTAVGPTKGGTGQTTVVRGDMLAGDVGTWYRLPKGTARQLLQMTVSASDPEWASNIDIPGTLDVTGAVVFDSTFQAPTNVGFGTAPSLAQGIRASGTLNGGINQVGIQLVQTIGSGTTSGFDGLSSYFTTPATVFTMANARMVRATNPDLGAGSVVTTLYGFYADALTSGGTNWAFYSVSTPSFFGGGVAVGGVTYSATTAFIVPAGVAGVSPLRIPHGVAPTTPVNGDIWTTTLGMFARIDGVTEQVAFV